MSKTKDLDWKNILLQSAFHVSEQLEWLLKMTKEYWRAYDRAKKRNKPRKKNPNEGIGPYEAMPKRMRNKAVAAMQEVIDAFRKENAAQESKRSESATTNADWRAMIDRLNGLCYKHPDALRESGFIFDGAADQMAMAACMEAARYAYYQSGGYCSKEDERLWKVEASVSRMLFYQFKAFSQAPARYRAACLNWVARNIRFEQYAHGALQAHNLSIRKSKS